MVRVAIIDEHPGKQLELRSFINAQHELSCSYTGNSLAELQRLINEISRPHIIIIGLAGDAAHGLSSGQLRRIKELLPETEILILGDCTDTGKIMTWFKAGVVGYLPCLIPQDQLKEAILGIRQGCAYIMPQMVRKMLDFFRSQEDLEEILTAREKEIVQCLVEGMSYKLIAQKLDVALDTVRYHLRNIYKKLHVNSKSQVISRVIMQELRI